MHDDAFQAVARHSLVFTLASVALEIVTGVLHATWRWRNVFRGLPLPWITSTVVVALAWRWVFEFIFTIQDFTIVHVMTRGGPPGVRAPLVRGRVQPAPRRRGVTLSVLVVLVPFWEIASMSLKTYDVWPERRVLVHRDRRPDVTALTSSLLLVKADRWPDQLGDDIDDRRL